MAFPRPAGANIRLCAASRDVWTIPDSSTRSPAWRRGAACRSSLVCNLNAPVVANLPTNQPMIFAADFRPHPIPSPGRRRDGR